MSAVVFDFSEERKHHCAPATLSETDERRLYAYPIKMGGMKRLTDREYREAAAARMKAARIANGLSNGDLARLLRVRPGRITSWEDGDALPNTPRLWDELCEALDITADYILRGRTAGLSRAMYAKLKQPMGENHNQIDA